MAAFDLDRIKTINLSLNTEMKEILTDTKLFNFANYEYITNHREVYRNHGETYENVFSFPLEILRNINNYRFIYKSPLKHIYDSYKVDDKGKIENLLTNQAVSSSLFNPLFNVQVLGMCDNVPLLNDTIGNNYPGDLGDCSIRELVRLSNSLDSCLGNARYRFTDFMYCRDLGKISNNHLITLRKFPYPVGDHIFKYTTRKYRNGEGGLGDYDNVGDVGRLVTWFDNEENKLSDILKYDYSASWKELNSKIQELDSKEDNPQRGPLGQILNTFNKPYNNMAAGGFTGSHNLLRGLGAKFQGPGDSTDALRNYDNNKVYTPLNTVQDTHIYEGKLKFNQEFNLVFTYKMRSYENINQKSAFLDLIANILEVTYRRGQFWGGAQKIVGPPPNIQGWKKANAFIDGAWDKLGGYLNALADGTLNLNDILGKIAEGASELLDKAKDGASSALSSLKGDGKSVTQTIAGALKNVNDKYGISQLLKGSLKNALGRPAMYAFDSLLPSGISGLWHVTIGNPKNPIMAMGNLIMTKASIQHDGPLGIDDFPTEIKVTVTLKHAKSRDLTSIAHMYTKGLGSMYISNARTSLSQWYKLNEAQQEWVKSYEQSNQAKQMGEYSASNKNDPDYIEDPKKRAEKLNTDADKFNQNISELNEKEAMNLMFESGFDGYLSSPSNALIAMTNQDRVITARSVIDEIA